MSNESAIRALSLEWGNKKIKSLLIGDRGRTAYKIIQSCGELTSSDFAEAQGISVQHASVVLARIYRQGYVSRLEVLSKTGGCEWVYRP